MKANNATISKPGKYRSHVFWEDVKRTYLVHVPRTYSQATPANVIVVLHGGGGSAEFGYRVHGWTDLSERRGCLVVFPEATAADPEQPAAVRENPRIWNDGSRSSAVAHRNVDDTGYLGAVLDAVQDKFTIDTNRIFVTGFSSGASMSFRAGVELSDRIAAIAPVSGHLCLDDPRPARPLSMLYMIGLADPINPLEGGPTISPWGARRIRPPVMDSIGTWIRLIQASDKPEVMRDSDGVRQVRFGPGQTGCEVQLHTIEGQGHEWPGAQRTLPSIISGPQTDKLDATETIWNFFAATHISPVAGR